MFFEEQFFLKLLESIPLGSPHSCSYLEGQIQQNQEFLLDQVENEQFELLLSQGFRHFGSYFFRYACQPCGKCLPIRIPIKEFKFSKSQKRLWRKNQEKVEYRISRPSYTEEKFEMYRRHLQSQFDRGQTETTSDFKFAFIQNILEQTHEFTYYYEDIPVGHGFVDILPNCLSSLYFFYDIDYSFLSLGTYSLLCEADYAQKHQKDYLYLGYYIQENNSMRYKAEIRPCEVFSPFGQWNTFRNAAGDYLISSEKARCHVPSPHHSDEEEYDWM